LDEIVEQYNETPHKGIWNYTPNEAEKYFENIREKLSEEQQPIDHLHVGNYVVKERNI